MGLDRPAQPLKKKMEIKDNGIFYVKQVVRGVDELNVPFGKASKRRLQKSDIVKI